MFIINLTYIIIIIARYSFLLTVCVFCFAHAFLDLNKGLKATIEKANEAANERKAFENRMGALQEKLRNIQAAKPQFSGPYDPLLAAVVERHILENNVI